MKYNDPTLREALASQYALGALQGRARARFERLLRSDIELRRLVQEWQTRLTPLAHNTRAVEPPERIFAAIERRLDGGSTATATWWDRLGFWRGVSATSAVAVIVLAISTMLLLTRPATIVPPSYIAVLEDSVAKQPALVVRAYPKPWRLVMEPLALPAAPAGKVLQVWAVEKGSGKTHALATVTPGKPQQLVLTEEYWKYIRNADTLAITIETAGAEAEAPTSPVLFSGLCINLKGG
jgi:anti-sigma-K factor RskA